jgi:hypothetical protein
MPDQRNRVHHGPFSTWQWAVIGAYFVPLILSAYVWSISVRADDNAASGNAAICVVNEFLRNSLRTTENLLRGDQDPAERKAREQSARRLRTLVVQLETELPSCRSALR